MQTLDIYSKNLEEILTKYSTELSNEISGFQMDFNQKNDNLLKFPWNSSEL